jgi:hypothetical protein
VDFRLPQFNHPLRRPVDDNIRRLLANHVNRHRDVVTRDLREHTRVHHPQSLNAADPELRVQHSHRVVVAANRASARSVMTPRLILDELLHIRLSRNVCAGPGLSEFPIKGDQVVEGLAGELHGFVQRLQILLVCSLGGSALVETAHGDLRHLLGVGGLQQDGAGVVARAGLEDDPDPVAGVLQRVLGVAGEIALEVCRRAGDEEVWVGGDVACLARGGGFFGDGDGDSVGGVDALVDCREAVLPGFEARVGGGVAEGAVLGQEEVGRSLADDADFVAVLEVGADAGEVFDEGNVEAGELFLGSDAAEFEQLGGFESAGGDDDFLLDVDGALGALGGAVAGVGGVEALAVEEVDAGGAGGALGGVEVDLSHEGVEGDVQVVLPAAVPALGVGNGEDKVTRAVALEGFGVDGDGNLEGRFGPVAPGEAGVEVLGQDLGETGDGVEEATEEALCVDVSWRSCGCKGGDNEPCPEQLQPR